MNENTRQNTVSIPDCVLLHCLQNKLGENMSSIHGLFHGLSWTIWTLCSVLYYCTLLIPVKPMHLSYMPTVQWIFQQACLFKKQTLNFQFLPLFTTHDLLLSFHLVDVLTTIFFSCNIWRTQKSRPLYRLTLKSFNQLIYFFTGIFILHFNINQVLKKKKKKKD